MEVLLTILILSGWWWYVGIADRLDKVADSDSEIGYTRNTREVANSSGEPLSDKPQRIKKFSVKVRP